MDISKFEASDYLDSEETISEFMATVMEDGNQDALLLALAHVAKARGMAKVAKDAGLSRESLYKSLSPGAKPGFDTVRRVMAALGVKLTAVSAR